MSIEGCNIVKENFPEICRFCLNNDHLTDIFTFDYEGTSFSSLINKLLFIKLNPDEDLPKNLCQTCIGVILHFIQFRQKCKENEIMLRTILTKSQASDRKFEFVDAAIKHEEPSYDERPAMFISDSLETMVKAEIQEPETAEETEKHLCPTCGKNFCSIKYLRIHIRSIHSNKKISCEICNKEFSFKQSLNQHRRTHTGEKPYTCSVCKRNFRENSTLTRHLRTHTGEKPYRCHICGKCFGYRAHMNIHIMNHLGDKPHKCEECGKGFLTPKDLNIHSRSHTKEKPYSCDICGQVYAHRHNWKRHVKNHSVEKPHMCIECGESFYQKGQLTMHSRTHMKPKIEFETNQTVVKIEKSETTE